MFECGWVREGAWGLATDGGVWWLAAACTCAAWLEHPLRINRLASDEQPPASASASHQVYVLR